MLTRSELFRAAVVAFIVAAPVAGAKAQCALFPGEPVSVPTPGGQPVASADFNADGLPDIVLSERQAGAVMVGINEGGRSFRFLNPMMIAHFGPIIVGDADGDGSPDLLVPGSQGLRVLIGRGDGTFEEPITLGAGVPSVSAAIADFNRDGVPDIADLADNAINLWFGSGDGSFLEPIRSPVPSGISGILAADVDRDGATDLVLGGRGPWMATYIGDGRFSPATPSTQPSGAGLAIGDLDGDGWVDAVVAATSNRPSMSGRAQIFLNNRTGMYQFLQEINPGFAIADIDLADFDADGDLDLALHGASSSVSQLFANATTVICTNNGGGSFVPGRSIPGATNASALVVCDFNADARPDVVVHQRTTTGPQQLATWLSVRDGDLPARTDVMIDQASSSAEAADISGDGLPDLLAAGSIGRPGPTINTIAISLQIAPRTFGPRTTLSLDAAVAAVRAGDLDGDGDLDLVAAFGDYLIGPASLAIFFNEDGAGTFSEPRRVRTVDYGSDLRLGDLDGDGDLDAVVSGLGTSRDGNSAAVHINDGSGNLVTVEELPVISSSEPMWLGDMDRDGDLDAAFLYAGDQYQYYSNLMVFQNHQGGLGRSFFAEFGLRGFALDGGDLDGDGLVDFVGTFLRSPTESALRIFYQRPGSTDFDIQELTISPQPRGVAVSDFDGDGRADIAVIDEATSNLAILRNLGDRRFDVPRLSLTRGQPERLLARDVDMDGAVDLIVSTPESRTGRHVSIHWNFAPCRADIDCAGVVDAIDLARFVECFRLGQPCAEIDGVPGIDLGDFFAFFDSYDGGC